MNWKPCKWRIEGADRIHEVTIESVARPDGPDRFAIRRGGAVLAKDGEWEYEPIPSSRDDDFFARCRYDSLEEATAFYANHVNND
jgi:hypothetical protein